MADSSITKKALAMSLKGLLKEHSFEKISVTDICEGCEMNRKSFYYHFKDKFDLLSWIFISEFIKPAREHEPSSAWGYIRAMCDYLYENRWLYKKVFKVEGQNSFSALFRDAVAEDLLKIIKLSKVTVNAEEKAFCLRFYSNMLYCSISMWLVSKDCDRPEQYVEKLHRCAEIAAGII